MGGESVTSSAAIDTGMIDGVSGVSRSWNPYWRSCGICHPDFMPHFIIHLNHFKEDAAVSIYFLKNFHVFYCTNTGLRMSYVCSERGWKILMQGTASPTIVTAALSHPDNPIRAKRRGG